MQERGERYRERMADVSEKVLRHIASMDADSILTRGAQVKKIDTVARGTFGLDSPAAGNDALNLNVLAGGRAIVQINQKNEEQSVVSAEQGGGTKGYARVFGPGRHSRWRGLEKFDRLARRNYGLSNNQGESGSLRLSVLGRGRTLIAIRSDDDTGISTPHAYETICHHIASTSHASG